MDLAYLEKIGLLRAFALPQDKTQDVSPTPVPLPENGAHRRCQGRGEREEGKCDAEAAAGVKILPRGTPLNADASLFSVVSYNLLAPLFVRPIDKRTGEVQPFAAFPWAEPAEEVLYWPARRPRLLAELRKCGADVLCLQEVQYEREGNSGNFVLPSWLQELEGYHAVIPAQASLRQMAERNLRVLDYEAAVGAAVLFRTDRLRLAEGIVSCPNTIVAACVQGLEGGPLAALQPTAIASVHLDAQSEEKRVHQLRKCFHIARLTNAQEVVIAGDMNTECLAGSCVAAMVAGTPRPTEKEMAEACASALRCGAHEDGDEAAKGVDAPSNAGLSEKELREWDALWEHAAASPGEYRIRALSHLKTGPTRASWDHGKSSGPCVTWRLDHIFYTEETLQLRCAWSALEMEPEAVAAGMPNRTCASDHLPVAACFLPRAAPRLGEKERAALLGRLEALEVAQKSEKAALERELDGRPQPAPPGEAPEPGKGKKKQLKPSPETIEHLQERRRCLRALAEKQAADRKAFLDALSDLEKDAFDGLLGGAGWALWLESGARQGNQVNGKRK